MLRMRSPQNFVGGVVLLIIGGFGLYFGADLKMGTAPRMGPGYFPMILSWGILFFAAVALFRAVTFEGPSIEAPTLRPISFMLAAILIFGALVDKLGLAAMGILITIIASYAGGRVDLKEALLLAVGLCALSIGLFVYVLGRPLPVWGRF